jgi:hypothetical protein
MAPATLKAPQLAHQLLKSDRAFATLLPTDLLDCVALRHVDDDVLLRMRAVRTVSWGARACWIIYGADSQSLCLTQSRRPAF